MPNHLTPAALLGEADRLDAEADALIAEATTAAQLAGSLMPGFSLLRCAASDPLRARAKDLRRDAAEASPAAAAGAQPASAPVAAPTQRPVPAASARMPREEAIQRIAGGAPFPLPAGMVEDAIASGGSVEAFALAMAEHCIREREVDAAVARIVGFAQPKALHATHQPTPQCDDAEGIARRIAAA